MIKTISVKELINELSQFDPDTKVVIGMVQKYGSDFAMEISNVSFEQIEMWDYEDEPCVVITEGKQIGSVCYDDDDEFDDEDDE